MNYIINIFYIRVQLIVGALFNEIWVNHENKHTKWHKIKCFYNDLHNSIFDSETKMEASYNLNDIYGWYEYNYFDKKLSQYKEWTLDSFAFEYCFKHLLKPKAKIKKSINLNIRIEQDLYNILFDLSKGNISKYTQKIINKHISDKLFEKNEKLKIENIIKEMEKGL